MSDRKAVISKRAQRYHPFSIGSLWINGGCVLPSSGTEFLGSIEAQRMPRILLMDPNPDQTERRALKLLWCFLIRVWHGALCNLSHFSRNLYLCIDPILSPLGLVMDGGVFGVGQSELPPRWVIDTVGLLSSERGLSTLAFLLSTGHRPTVSRNVGQQDPSMTSLLSQPTSVTPVSKPNSKKKTFAGPMALDRVATQG